MGERAGTCRPSLSPHPSPPSESLPWSTTNSSRQDALFYPTPEHCHADMASLLQRRQLSRRRGSPPPPPDPYGRPSRVWNADNDTCTALPCDGWIDNAGWEINGEGNAFPLTVGQFNSTYVLPGIPKQREAPANCTFNYTSSDSCPGLEIFIGLEK